MQQQLEEERGQNNHRVDQMQGPVRRPAPKVPWPKRKEFEQDFKQEQADDRQGEVAEQFHIPDFFLGHVGVEERGKDLQHDEDNVDNSQEQDGEVGGLAFDFFTKLVAETADTRLVSVRVAAVLIAVLAVKRVRGDMLVVIGGDVGLIPGIVDGFAVGSLCDD